MQISFAVTVKLISAFVLATYLVQFLYYLNLKFQAFSHLVLLHSLVCVGSGTLPSPLYDGDQLMFTIPLIFVSEISLKVISYLVRHQEETGTFGYLCNVAHLSLVVRKPVFGVSNQVRHKPGCTATEDG